MPEKDVTSLACAFLSLITVSWAKMGEHTTINRRMKISFIVNICSVTNEINKSYNFFELNTRGLTFEFQIINHRGAPVM